MTIISKELEERLKKLEVEQDNQDTTLKGLGDFEEEIRKLEKTLAQIDQYLLSQDQDIDYSNLRDIEQIEKLEKKLATIDQEFMEEISFLEEQPAIQSSKKAGSVETSEKKTASSATKKASTPTTSEQSGYVICLVFNPKSPPEWSGKGWSEQGKGFPYPTLEQAKQVFQKIKKHWPDYPLKIIKR